MIYSIFPVARNSNSHKRARRCNGATQNSNGWSHNATLTPFCCVLGGVNAVAAQQAVALAAGQRVPYKHTFPTGHTSTGQLWDCLPLCSTALLLQMPSANNSTNVPPT